MLLQVTTETMLEHKNKLLQISGSKLLFGGEPLKNHSIPPIYGAIEPTAIYVPLEEILKGNNFDLVTREIFGPFQVTQKRHYLSSFYFSHIFCNVLYFIASYSMASFCGEDNGI